MGRLTPVRGRRRGILDRPLVFFGLLMFLPAAGFGLLGWRSVVREVDLQQREAEGEARDVLTGRLRFLADDLRLLEARESERPYFAYQRQFAPEQTAFQQLDFQSSPLTRTPEDRRLLGWFQWELGTKGVFQRAEIFGPTESRWNDGLEETYGPELRRRLATAARDVDLRAARRVNHTLRVVAANEELGQLFEEIQIVQQGQARAQAGGETPNPNRAAQTPYLENFLNRVGDEPVPVRYGAFRYLARDAEAAGPPLVAWRIVWIPDAYADRREIGRDRWLLQGYALDPGRDLPTTWESVGSVRLLRGDRATESSEPGAGGHEGTLVDLLDAEVLARGATAGTADLGLSLIARPDPALLDAGASDVRLRFLWLVAGVMAVVGVGFFVLTRGVRREVALARRKEDFLAAVTHELKTPLAGIRMYAEMLREGWVADAEASDRYATRILSETDRLGHLVNQVLDLAALERGVARANAMPGDLALAVGEAVDLVRPKADAVGVELLFEAEEGLPPVVFDPRHVKPLVLNLLDNAIKYSDGADTKQARVTVRRDGDRIALIVADRGIGIDPKRRRGLFEPFQRAGDELTRTAPGVGIGLALVKRYADAHGARVQLESELGQGTTVTVRFPV